MQAHAAADANPFSSAHEQFENLVARLGGAETAGMTHAEVERLLQAGGTELLRRLYQGHLDARGIGEASGPVTGGDGVTRTHARLSGRELDTVFGPVQIGRIGYGRREVESLYPRDAELNVPPESYSHGVRRPAAEKAARGSFDEAVDAVGQTTGAQVEKRQVEQLIPMAMDFDTFYDGRTAATPAAASKTAPILVLTTDGKGVVMRPEALREATKKAASKRERKLRKRLAKNEKTATRRMATVASVYTIEPLYRTPEDRSRSRRGGAQTPRAAAPRAKARVGERGQGADGGH